VRVARPDAAPLAPERLQAWLDEGQHGSMDWMAETADRRADPRALWPEVRSIILLGLNYAPTGDPLASLALKDRGTISVYARNRDYHDVIKGKLKEAAGFLASRGGSGVKVFVDTAPVMEKPLAEAAGLGWQGKHTVLVSREFGNWLFLGAIFTTAELPADEPEQERCGSCRRCLDACPTNAFPAPFQLDARRCISYLTIEHKGPIPPELRPGIGNRIFGCDDCLAVCPWNKFAQEGREARLAQRDDLAAPPLAELARLDDAAFRARFAGTPIKRTGRDRFIRNVLIAIGNSREPALVAEAVRLLADASPLVRGAAVWALSRLLPEPAFREASAERFAAEPDEQVRAEWERALGAWGRGRRLRLLAFGFGYTALFAAQRLHGRCRSIAGTVRSAAKAAQAPEGVRLLTFGPDGFDRAILDEIARATHVLVSVQPDGQGDPVLRTFGESLTRARDLSWIGYLSTIGVYGDHGGAWIDETTATAAGRARSQARIDVEQAWLQFGEESGKAVHVFRLGGIYGPGRNPLVNLKEGTARRIVKPGQVFNRVHVADIAAVIEASMARPRAGALYNAVDDEPAPPQDVVAFAAGLLGVDPPPEIPFEEAELSPMGRGFYSENRRVSNRLIRDELGVRLAYPSYREGVRALYEAGEGA
jgi:epoxyqueuosine reductase